MPIRMNEMNIHASCYTEIFPQIIYFREKAVITLLNTHASPDTSPHWDYAAM
jgi:hypothetical protein